MTAELINQSVSFFAGVIAALAFVIAASQRL